jgi:DNA-binding LacI/PurR family transcriptional regulator
MATMKEVAKLAGVSVATVSRVLNNQPNVSPELRSKVLEAVKELSYQRNRVARSLRARRSRIIGLIISDIQNPFFTSLVRAVEDVAYEHQYAVFLCNSDENVEKETLYVDLMCAEKVAGVVISPTCETDSPSQKLIEVNIPVVAVDRRMLDLAVDTVMVDNVGAAFELVSHLIDDGHRHIAAVLGTPIATTGHERREGYVQALKAHGLPILPDLIRTGPPKETVGYRLTGEFLDLSDRPTALFTGNNLLTVGALRAIYERGLRIPDDIALGAFDELDWMSLVEPPLTVVAQPTYELGRTAADLLLKRIEDGTRPPQEVVLKPTILIRQSCAHHAETSPLGVSVQRVSLRGTK